ncbi:HlyD family efflux transporter periplasmic adaptor subunit [Novosphingobium sp. PY1]|uniref:Membrane fusion component of tripartite multidrug resistance system n=1 Tax=Ochrobactrum sp. PW1 TaxID=1882222 RepID=A0A292GM51_9HYPH|nr:HlyD family efflux transporter periplasmic adaptor subunit [Novosphingobium sp. PY1]BBA74555.1 membrane fusion component of tripartite multidrug resistance system [Ochrobactrum sp. PW1]GFM29404.1 membrane fusion component of tripartite multidrug resistance system [Novosphingobium sp. PY1]
MADIDPGTFGAIEEVELNASSDIATKIKRKRLFAALACGIAIIGGGAYAYDTLVASKHAVTDNAYVGADVAQVTSQIAGPVSAVLVEDTQQVHRGDVLVRLDDTDARIAVARAEADLARAMRKVQGIQATDTGLNAQISARAADAARADAEMAAAKASFDKAQIDLDRRQSLVASGAVSADEVTAVRNALNNAQAGLRAAQASRAQADAAREAAIGERNANRALIANVTVDNNPEVLAARAELDQARVNLERTVIRAPIDGVVSKRQVQVGQRVQPGAMLMVVVPVQAAYVDANFKEVELAHVHPGQTAELTSDLYGEKVVYHGKVVGFSGGTGAAFAIVPAQNATGNWIKVVQRLPVRIKLDAKELAAHPLRVGLSMNVDVNVSK